jgi:hypothetical protein
VPVSLHVPSLQIFESVFDKTLADVDSLVDLRLTYIGQLNETMQPYGVEWSVSKLPASMAPP